MDGAFHVAFVASAPIIAQAVEALTRYHRDGDPSPLEQLLATAWRERQRRRDQTRVVPGRAEREEIERHLEGEAELLAAFVATPAEVRESAAADATHLAGLYARLRELEAPEVVQRATRERLSAAIAALDPATPYPEEPVPAVARTDDGMGEEGAGVNLHDWLYHLLEALWPEHLVGLGSKIDGYTWSDQPAVTLFPEAVAPGIELTSYGMAADEPAWTPAGLLLPRPLCASWLVVVGISGGPATFALAGDLVSDLIHPELAAAVSRLSTAETPVEPGGRWGQVLAPDEALVSFVGLVSDIEWPWSEPGSES